MNTLVKCNSMSDKDFLDRVKQIHKESFMYVGDSGNTFIQGDDTFTPNKLECTKFGLFYQVRYRGSYMYNGMYMGDPKYLSSFRCVKLMKRFKFDTDEFRVLNLIMRRRETNGI